MYKLVAIDIDGTLLNSNREITDGVKSALKKAKQAGVKVVICTGRPLPGVKPILKELGLEEKGDYAISFNGALVQDTHTGEPLVKLTMTYEDLLYIHSCSLISGLHMHFADDHDIYTPNRDIGKYTVLEAFITECPLHYRPIDDVPRDIIISKAMFIDEEPLLNEGIKKIPAPLFEQYTVVRSNGYFLEVLSKEAGKGNAVRLLAEKLGIDRSEIIAIGDQENDLAMIEYAGMGVAMGNAIDAVKAKANHITTTNDEDGVAKAIEKFIFGA